MFRLILLVNFLLIINGNQVSISREPSYFEQRKQMLKNQEIVLHTRPKRSNLIDYYYGPHQRRPADFKLIINEPNLCSKHEKVFLIIYIRSFYGNIYRRNFFREVFSLYKKLDSPMNLVYAFLFGQSKDRAINKKIKAESLLHGDILQESYIDHYVNQTLKSLQAWKWSLEYCPNADYVMVINDDLVLDLLKIVSFLYNDNITLKHDDHFALCHKTGNYKVNHLKDPDLKNLPPYYLYQGEIYPYFCNGYGYAAHITVINKLYFASKTNPYFIPDDVWVGVLAEKLRLEMTNHMNHFAAKANVLEMFLSPYYRNSPVMIGVANYTKNKQDEEKELKNLISVVIKYYEGLGTLNEKHVFEIKYFIYLLWFIPLFTIIFIGFKLIQPMCKLFCNFYKKMKPF